MPTALCSAAMYRRRPNAAGHALRRCSERGPLPTTPCSATMCPWIPAAQCGNVQKALHYLMPSAVRRRTKRFTLSATHCSAAVCTRICIARYPQQWGMVGKEGGVHKKPHGRVQ